MHLGVLRIASALSIFAESRLGRHGIVAARNLKSHKMVFLFLLIMNTVCSADLNSG